MKKLIAPFIVCIMFFGLILSCRKIDNPRLGSLSQVPLPNLIDSSGTADQLIPNDSNFSRSFTVALYDTTVVKPRSIDIVVVKNGAVTNYNDTSIKVLRANITSFPAVITFDSADIVSLFGPIKLGDIFEIGANVTTLQGTLYPAFVAGTSGPDSLIGGTAYGVDILKLPGENVLLTYKSPCAYDGSIFSGSYTIVTDGWADYNPGDAVPAVVGGPSPGQLTITLYPNPAFGTNRQPFVVNIDTTNAGAGNVTVASQIIGDYPGAPNMAVKTSGSDSYVDFCSGVINLDLDFTDGNSVDYGSYVVQMSK